MKHLLVIFAVFLSLVSQAQEEAPEMADVMRSNGKIYVVVGVISIVFIGLLINMIRLEKKMGNIEKELND